MSAPQTVAIIGTGTMGCAIASGLLRSEMVAPEHLRGTIRHAEKAAGLSTELGFEIGTDSAEIARTADIVLLCTKPAVTPLVLAELASAGALEHAPLLISIAAGVSIETLRGAVGSEARIVRAMPNTPCLIGEGMTVLCSTPAVDADAIDLVHSLFLPLGRVLELDEEYMDAVTGLSASGPAFVYVIIEALSDGGVMMGLPRKTATELAAQAVQGAARMVLQTGRHPAELKDEVTTPAGCTVSALLALEDGKLRSVLARGVEAAAHSAARLG